MSKKDALKTELEKMGIITDVDLRSAIRKTSLDITLMTVTHKSEERAG